MTHSKFIRLSGWGMIVAAICLLLTFLPDRAWPFYDLSFALFSSTSFFLAWLGYVLQSGTPAGAGRRLITTHLPGLKRTKFADLKGSFLEAL